MTESPFQLRKAIARSAFAALVVAGLFCGASAQAASPTIATEQGFKASFLFNLTQFVTWPSTAFPTVSTPFVIGIIGTDPFGGLLDDLVHNESVDGRKIVIKRSARVADLKTCQIVFISQSEAGRAKDILQALADTSALTVSDIPRFCQMGGMMAVEAGAKGVAFEIHVTAAKSVGLRISSKVLKLARKTY